METKTTKKSGSKAKEPLAQKHKDALAIAVANGDPKVIAKAVAQANNTPALYNQKLTDAHLEIIINRIAAGDLMSNICLDLGVSAALVRRRACDDREGFGAALHYAKILSAEHSFDRQLEIAFDMTMEAAHKKIIIDVLDRRAKVLDRSTYTETVKHQVEQVTINLTKEDRGLT